MVFIKNMERKTMSPTVGWTPYNGMFFSLFLRSTLEIWALSTHTDVETEWQRNGRGGILFHVGLIKKFLTLYHTTPIEVTSVIFLSSSRSYSFPILRNF